MQLLDNGIPFFKENIKDIQSVATFMTPETQMEILKRLFDNTLSDYKRDIWDINEITKNNK